MNPPAGLANRLTVVIVNYNSGPWLARCLASVLDGPDPPACIVLDNASVDTSLEKLDGFESVHLIRSPVNRGFGPAVNQAAGLVHTPAMLILNPDCLVGPDDLHQLLDVLEADEGVAMVSGRVLDETGQEQRASRRRLPTPARIIAEFLPARRRAGQGVDLTETPVPGGPVDVEALSGACMLVRTAAFRALGGFDEGFRMHFEDLDLMARLQKQGWRLRLVPGITVRHAGGVSSRHRRLGVHWTRHAGLWRYLSIHCQDQWPRWSRPFWAVAIATHALAGLPRVLFGRQ